MRILIPIISLIMVGCGSTPYQDDYTKHVNLLGNNYLTKENYKFSFVDDDLSVDLRGLYSQNDTTASTPIMYYGDAGIAGALVQLTTHSVIINSQRDAKLASQQIEADQFIQPLINLSRDISLNDLVGEHRAHFVAFNQQATDTVVIKPIFFSLTDMSELSLKAIVWMTQPKDQQQKRQKFKYRNMIQVYSPKLTESQYQQILEGDKNILPEILTSLLKKTLDITEAALTGQYDNNNKKTQTFLINTESNNQVLRGFIAAEKCDYQVIQDIHHWLVAYPIARLENQADLQCEKNNNNNEMGRTLTTIE
jgi:hypothetical protein